MRRHERDVEAGLLEDLGEGIPLLPLSADLEPLQPPNTALLRQHSDQDLLTEQNEATTERKDRIAVLEDHADEDALAFPQTEHSSRNKVPINEQRHTEEVIRESNEDVTGLTSNKKDIPADRQFSERDIVNKEATAKENDSVVVPKRRRDALTSPLNEHSLENNVVRNGRNYCGVLTGVSDKIVTLTPGDNLGATQQIGESNKNTIVTEEVEDSKGESSGQSRDEEETGERLHSIKFKHPTPKFHPSANSDDDDNTSRTRNALHKAALAQDTATLRSLIAAGASVGALDSTGRTPLHLCIEHKLLEPFKILLTIEGATEVTDARGLPVLHVAVQHCWREGVRAALTAGADVTAIRPIMTDKELCEEHTRMKRTEFGFNYPQTPMHWAIASGDMAMLDEILSVAEQRGVINCQNRVGESPLYTAIEFGYLEAVKVLLKRGASVHLVSDRGESALHIAIRHPDILKYLLDTTGATLAVDMFHYTPIHCAAATNQAASLDLLIDKFGEARVKTSNPRTVTNITALELAVGKGHKDAVEVILAKDADAIHIVNDDKDTALHVAIKKGQRDMVVLLLKRGAILSAKGHKEFTAIEMIATNFYNPSDFFELVFDEFIYMEDYLVCVDYKALTNIEGMSQIKVLEEFVRCNQSSVLKHPLIESLLYLKWRLLLSLFFCMIVLYTIFLVTFNIFVVNIFSFRDTKDEILINGSLISNFEKWCGVNDGWYWLLIMLIYLSICLLFVQELFYIKLKRLHYFTYLESWVKLCGLTLGTLVPAVAGIEADWPRHVACAAVLLSWLQAMFLLARIPQWGNYVLMFGKVATNIFKTFVTTIFLVLGFSFCFMIQYKSTAPFDGLFAAFVKTLVMMSSEFDYEDLFGEDHGKELQYTRTVVRLMFVLFVIFVAIVLMNFIIGVAVSDINELNVTGKIRMLEKQLDVLSNMDALAKMYKLIRRREYHNGMKNFVRSRSDWYVSVDAEEVRENEYILHVPSTLNNDIIDIAKKKTQRTEKDGIKNAFKNKIDEIYNAVVDNDQTDLKQRNDFGLSKQELKIQNEQIKVLTDSLIDVRQEIKSCNQNFQKLANDMAIIKEMLLKK